MKKDRIKVGIIGLGRAGWAMHAAELQKFSDMFSITAVCDVDLKRAKSVRDRLGPDVHCYQKHGDLIADPEVELGKTSAWEVSAAAWRPILIQTSPGSGPS